MAYPKKVDRNICGDIWTTEDAEELLRFLTVDIHHRLAGSPGEKRAQQHILAKFKKWGLATDFQKVKVPTWKRGPAYLRIQSKRITRDIVTMGMIYSESTHGKFVEYPVIDLGPGLPGDFERAGRRIRGKAALFHVKDYEEMAITRNAERMGRAVAAGAKAVIIGLGQATGVAEIGAIKPNLDPSTPAVPGIAISREAAGLIGGLVERGRVTAKISVEGKTFNRTTGNVIGKLPGRRKSEEIILGAHIDSMDIAAGAVDNASGCAVICEVARLFSLYKPKLLRPVTFVLFTGEELGCLGSIAYAEKILDPEKAALFFNFDMPVNGGYPHVMTMVGKYCPKVWDNVRREASTELKVKEILATCSDHYAFYTRGVPVLWIAADKDGTRGPETRAHSRFDTFDKIDMTEFREATMLAAKIVMFLATVGKFPFEKVDPVTPDTGTWLC